jgi:hypothetical protein
MNEYKVTYHPNGRKHSEQYYDLQGEFHRDCCLPDYHSWYPTGISILITYYIHGVKYNLNNPCWIRFTEKGKIDDKYYDVNDKLYQNKLIWMNNIKKI